MHSATEKEEAECLQGLQQQMVEILQRAVKQLNTLLAEQQAALGTVVGATMDHEVCQDAQSPTFHFRI
jgi:hypothetical protein